MTNPIGRFHDLTTGEIVDRELTNEEVKELNSPKHKMSPLTESTETAAE
jgi:hypothetical protein